MKARNSSIPHRDCEPLLADAQKVQRREMDAVTEADHEVCVSAAQSTRWSRHRPQDRVLCLGSDRAAGAAQLGSFGSIEFTMTWTLVGYFPKQRTTRSRWVSPFPDDLSHGFPFAAPVDEICSVSKCISKGPEGWRDQRKENFYDVYNNPDLAWSVVPGEVRADFELFAYRLYLVEFDDGREEPMEQWWELAVVPMSDSFVRLGWDAVVGGNHHCFGCSPMSCNAGCDIVEIAKKNR